MHARKNFLKIFLIVTFSFFLFKIITKYIALLGMHALIIESTLLFLAGVLFYFIAKKTEYRSKEVSSSALSAIFIYFSIFEVPDAMGIIYLSTFLSIFVIFFLVFLLIQGGEFHRVFFNLILFLLFFVKFVTQLYPNYFYFASILILGVLLSIFFFIKGTNSNYFEKASFYSVGFSVSVILVAQIIIAMVTGK